MNLIVRSWNDFVYDSLFQIHFNLGILLRLNNARAARTRASERRFGVMSCGKAKTGDTFDED